MSSLRAAAAALFVMTLLSACSDEQDDPCAGAPPVAVAGPDRTVPRGTQVQLEGSSGGAGSVSYVWRLDAVPAGSAAAVAAATDARATFTADLPGVYVASLVVADGCAASAPDATVIVVPNAPPVADAGAERAVEPGEEVALDGGGSGDADGDALTYSWSLAASPAGSGAALAGADTSAPTFVADLPGTYVALLVVSDGFTRSEPSAVTIVAGGGGAAGCSPAARPVAKAGPDVVSTSKSVYLFGSGTSSRGAALSYRWSITSKPEGTSPTVGFPTSSSTYFYGAGSGVYVVTLVVNDGCQDSLPDSVTITLPDQAPTASAFVVSGQPLTGKRVELSGSGSDPAGDAVTLAWSLVSAPAASAATLENAATSQPSFVPDVDGTYVVSLVASDGNLTSAPYVVTVVATNRAPVAKAGYDLAAKLGDTLTLDGSSSSDENGTALGYGWTLVARPPGSAATLAGASTARPSLVPDVEGVYVARLVVSDGTLAASDDVTVAVWPAVRRLSVRLLDADYSRALDRIVTVSAVPQALHLVDPRTLADTAIALGLAPTAVSVGPDGLLAAVGHANGISIVDLVSGDVDTYPVVGTVSDVVLAGNGWVYASLSGSSSERARILALRRDTGLQLTALSGGSGAARLQLRPGDGALYAATGSYSSLVERYDLAAGAPVLAAYASTYGACGDLWMTEQGGRLFDRCGGAFRISSAPAEDLTAAGALRDGSTTSLAIRHLSDSSAAGELSAITPSVGEAGSPADAALRRYDSASLALLESAPLPSEVVNGTSFRWRGRFVFYRADGTERYALLQLDPAAGALLDFGILTF